MRAVRCAASQARNARIFRTRRQFAAPHRDTSHGCRAQAHTQPLSIVIPGSSFFLTLACAPVRSARGAVAKSNRVEGRQLFVENKPFRVRGICYSPTPINESVYFAPYGDYFTAEYSYIWMRDLPAIKAMGVNVVRTYGWQPANDHTAFIKALASHGLYLFATFYMGDEGESPVGSAHDRAALVKAFGKEVGKYAEHKNVLFWSFGNELNGVWNKFLQALSKDDGSEVGGEACGWDERYDDLGGCWVHKGVAPVQGDPLGCFESSYCVYSRLFKFIDDAAAAAKDVADVLVVSAFADVDALYDKVDRAGDFAPNVDAWTAQVYRGDSFGNFFEAMGNSTDKPILLTEYGVDAYHDVCGSKEDDDDTPCANTYLDLRGSHVDEDAQMRFAVNLTLEIDAAASDYERCTHSHKGRNSLSGKSGESNAGECTCIGGFLMSWTDEYWKGAKSQAACDPPKGSAVGKFDPKTCDPKAHVTCGNWDAMAHDVCGYPLQAAPDHYVNEEWFGITSPAMCSASIDALTPRDTYWAMRKMWTGQGKEKTIFSKCDDMLMGQCIALGDGGSGGEPSLSWLGQLIGGETHGGDGKPLPCSGRGKCTTNIHECGDGTYNVAATPCCSCQLGFAGVGCTQLDVRVYVALAVGGTLAVLLGGMCLSALVRMLTGGRLKSSALNERLLSQ
jgi:hypothetical protein